MQLRRLARLAPLAIAAASAPAPATAATSADPGAATAIKRLVARSGLGAQVSVTVTTLQGATVVRVRDSVPRVPASNQKLETMLAAIDRLGAATRLETSVVAPGPVSRGVLLGSLYLVGAGDPTLSTRALARNRFSFSVATVDDLALAIKRAGIRRISGGIVGVGTLFDAKRAGPGWKSGFSPFECAPLSALSLDEDEGAAGYAYRPELTSAQALARALKARGIRVGRPATVGSAPDGARRVAGVPGAKVGTILRLAGKNSDNFVAETMLKDVAAYADGVGVTARGAAAVRRTLVARGVNVAGVTVADGSGLSLDNRTTTRALVGVLVAAAKDRRLAAPLRDALAIAGVDGTLIHRMQTGPAHRVVHAKTGTLNEASALSGYAGRYAFSVIVNAPGYVDITRAHALQDGIAQVLAGRR